MTTPGRNALAGVGVDGAIGLFLFSLVFLPDAARVAGHVFEVDLFYHWDHFVMAQALAHQHGMALPLDVYAPYGLGWPTLVSLLSELGWRLSHQGVIAISAVAYALYAVVSYALLRAIVGRRLLATTGTLLFLWLDLFSPLFAGHAGVATSWQWPSMLALRAPLDVAFFLALLLYARSGRASLAALAAALLGASLLFATDTGLMLLGAGVVYVACQGLFGVEPAAHDDAPSPAPGGSASAGRAAAIALVAFLIVLAIGLAASTHGRFATEPVATLASWIGGMTTAVGASARPFNTFLAAGEPGLGLAAASLAVCLFAVVDTASKALHRRLDPASLVLGCVGLYGVGRLVFFVWNSEPLRTRLAAPAVAILLTVGLARGLEAIARRMPASRAEGAIDPMQLGQLVALSVAAVLLVSSPTFAVYPNVWHLDEAGAPEGLTYLLPDRREILVAEAVDRRRGEALRAAIEAVSARTRAGESVAVLDPTKTFIYLEAGARPWSGDAALFMNTWTRDGARRLIERLESTGPAYVLVRREIPPSSLVRDTWLELRRALARRYRTLERLATWDLLYCERCRDRTVGPDGDRFGEAASTRGGEDEGTLFQSARTARAHPTLDPIRIGDTT